MEAGGHPPVMCKAVSFTQLKCVYVKVGGIFFSVFFLPDLSLMTAGKSLPGSFLDLALWEIIH